MGGRKTELLYGFHSVYEALKAGRRQFETIFISSRRSLSRADKILSIAEKKKTTVQTIDPQGLDRMTSSATHQGIAARVSPFPSQKGQDLIHGIQNRETPYFILVMEGIEDPQNMGALIRTALCADVDYILIPKDRSALPSPSVSRSSAGAMEHAPIYMITNTASILREIKAAGGWVSGLDAQGKKGLYEADLTGNLALIIGGEHKGIRPGVKKECDFLLSIPISGKINSLNASVAGGIAMYEAGRQRALESKIK